MNRTSFSTLLCAGALAGALAACTSDAAESELASDLTAAQRLARETTIRDVAAQFGLRNGLLLAGLAEAEVYLQHCWSEATWACQGPYSSECGGPVVAGSGDGACSLRAGGLGMFQFDRGNHDQTLAAHGQKILSVAGSVEEAVTFVANMAINSIYTPAHVVDRASALAWLDQVAIDGPSYDAWLKTVVHYYNGCVPGQCSVYAQRRQKYDTALRTVWSERGAAFWQAAPSAGGTWVMPLPSTAWKIEFDIVNPYVSGQSSCFGRPLNQLVHAGEDWGTAAGTAVKAIGAGTVVYAANASYPGNVVVIRHTLTEAQRLALGISTTTIYSQYGHLGTLQVAAGNAVSAGQQIGTIYNWGGNSHLHWEVRTAEKPQLCGYNHPGPGYTNTGTHPQTWGYIDPANAVTTLANTGGGGATTCDNNVPLNGTACAAQGETVEYVCKRPGQPSNLQWDVRACAAGSTCQGAACTPTGGGWNCADSAWGTGQVWTCGADGDRHKCVNGVPVEEDCSVGCMGRNPGQDDLCIASSPGWNCANSAWNGGQLWTCSAGDIYQCQGGAPVKVDCPSGCLSNPLGTNDVCL